MNRRGFFKSVAGAAVGVLVAPVAAKKAYGIDCSNPIKFGNGCIKISPYDLVIYTEDECWLLKGDPCNGTTLTKLYG